MRSDSSASSRRNPGIKGVGHASATGKVSDHMTSRGTKYWNSGAIPLIAPEILGNIIAEVADLGIVISDTGEVLSVLVNPMYDSFRALERFENRDIRSALTTESVPKFENRLAEFLEGSTRVRAVELK